MSNTKTKSLISIIIPVHNEQLRLPGTMEKIAKLIHTYDLHCEVIIVENGSNDLTYQIAKSLTNLYPFIFVIREFEKGKGLAVRRGMLEAKGDYRIFTDADLSVPIEQIFKFLPPSNQTDIAIASRELPSSKRINEPWKRHFIGRIFNLLVGLLIIPEYKDTQCGFKCFSAKAAEDIFNFQTLNGWSFDVEILYLAKLKKYSISEIPVTWYYQTNSKVNPIKDSWNMFFDILKIYRNKNNGLYGNL